MNDKKSQPEESDRSTSEPNQTHPIAAGLGAASGGIAGAAIG
jgi:hypothetical protein